MDDPIIQDFTPCTPNCEHCKPQVKAIAAENCTAAGHSPEEVKFVGDAQFLHNQTAPFATDSALYTCPNCSTDIFMTVELFNYFGEKFYHTTAFFDVINIYMNEIAYQSYEDYNGCIFCWFQFGVYPDGAIMMALGNQNSSD